MGRSLALMRSSSNKDQERLRLDFKSAGASFMILMQLFNNLPRETMFGQEMLKMVREYKNKNILMKGGFQR